MDLSLQILRSKAPANEFDYGFVMDCLKHYGSPRNKLTSLLKSGAIIRVKKGLYIFGESYRKGNISMETLANMIYGPSYVSLEWALRYYGMIPENVVEVTSVTPKRKALFTTPVGRFSYEHCPPASYPVGLTRYVESEFQSALLATKEKAVADLLVLRRGKITSQIELQNILFQDFRMEPEDVSSLDLELIKRITEAKPHSALTHLIAFLEKQ